MLFRSDKNAISLNTLVFNAAITLRTSFETTTLEDWDRVDEDGADEDDAGAACFALAADLVGCQGNRGGGVGQGQVSRHLGFQAG